MTELLPIPNPSELLLPWLVVLAAAAVGAATDLRAHRLPNWLTLTLWAGGLAYSTASGGLLGLGGGLLASILLALPYVILFVFAGGGAGDAKMLAGIGAWLGLSHGALALVAIALVGGVAGILVGFLRRQGRQMIEHLALTTSGFVGMAYGRLSPGECFAMMPPAEGGRRFPYGAAILVGAVSAFVGGQLWHA